MSTIPHHTWRSDHPGSTKQEILEEPEWHSARAHRIGFRDRENRVAGLTHVGDERKEDQEFWEQAQKKAQELKDELGKGELLSVRDFMTKQEDYHLRTPAKHSQGWRYVLHTTENFVKYEQPWPANIQKEEKKGKEEPKKEHEWRRGRGQNTTHHKAYATQTPDRTQDEHEGMNGAVVGDEKQKPKPKYTAQESALLRLLKEEKNYVKELRANDGKGASPAAGDPYIRSIDEADQFTPDNWIPRSSDFIRLTGKHPLNGEADLTTLFDAGLITPNRLHYVRNHGHVPHLLWETHKIDIENGKMALSMDELSSQFDSINIPIAIACDGNRRKELNMIRRSKGFNWGSGAVSCAYWRGALLCDVLLAAGIEKPDLRYPHTRRYVNFEGSEELSGGKYSTCLDLEYAMDPMNDVLLAYQMNDYPLPPDHGYPVRLMIPGYVGGKCVKWLSRIWTSEKENDSYYHIFDNRVLPSFIREKDSEFAETMFSHPSTECREQNLNSVIVKPAHGEKIELDRDAVAKNQMYRVQGYAYDGGGHEVQRVEISLDAGETWLYCVRKFPDAPIRHGTKFWTWIHWYIDIEVSHLLHADGIRVRCFNVFKNTQPEHPSWNIMGMMNNCWYLVRSEAKKAAETGKWSITFQHPCEPGAGEGGWMKPSGDPLEDRENEESVPDKQFTRQEIEKHNKEDDCWIVINGKVYDSTSVLSWHPGGKAAIMGHAGKVHADTTEEFESVHDDYAQQKLSECVLGTITDKAKDFIKRQAEEVAKERAKDTSKDSTVALDRHRWKQVRFMGKEELSKDTRRYTFSLPKGSKSLGLSTCQHIQLGFHFSDRLVMRSYTPTRPVQEDDVDGTFDLVVKTYFPSDTQPGGTLSNVLDCLRDNEEVEVKGPSGQIKYTGNGRFLIDDVEHHFDNISLILGGSGITPGYQLIARILSSKDPVDQTNIKVIDANKSENDILMRSEMDEMSKEHPDQFQVTHVLSKPGDEWKGERGFVTEDIIRKYAFEASDKNVALLCGPPGLIQKAVLPSLKDLGYEEDKNMFGF
ncbi:hypothetical protein FQN54_009759 [Arachnomyces sp. PD_36]|nr:hypothetical protein FQN54_009759 [Arachnomyces sp. PD_36]